MSDNQLEHIKWFLRKDWVREDQMQLVIANIIEFIAIGYDDFIKNKQINWNIENFL